MKTGPLRRNMPGTPKTSVRFNEDLASKQAADRLAETVRQALTANYLGGTDQDILDAVTDANLSFWAQPGLDRRASADAINRRAAMSRVLLAAADWLRSNAET